MASLAAAEAQLIQAVLGALTNFGARKRMEEEALLLGLLEDRYPQVPAPERLRIVHDELAYEAEYQRKMRLRLQKDMAQIVRMPPAARTKRLEEVKRREARFLRMRHMAMTERAIAGAEYEVLSELSPRGAYWKLGENVKNHTLDCLAMAGRFWPWSILRKLHPPMHHGCACELYGEQEALDRGFMSPGDIRSPEDMELMIERLSADIEELRHKLDEATLERFRERWSAAQLQEGYDPEKAADQVADWLGIEEERGDAMKVLREAYDPRQWRNRVGEWVDMPDVSEAPKRTGPRTRVARGYADAAQLLADLYTDKLHRDLERGVNELPGFLRDASQEELRFAGISLYKYEHDTGRTMVSVTSSLLDGPDRRGRGAFADDPEATATITSTVREMTAKSAASRLESQRKQLRGAVALPKGEDGKRAYRALDAAVAQNDALPQYASLRDRFPGVPDNIVMVGDKGFGRTPLADVLVTATRSRDIPLTYLNGVAMTVHQRMAEEVPGHLDGPNGPHSVKPGDWHVTTREPAGVLRHEWAHALWEEGLTDEQRQGFIDLLPDWDGIAEGLSKYAAGSEETRDRPPYNNPSNPLPGGYYTETFAEAVALTTGPHFVRDRWPDWVGRVADYIGDLRA